MSVIQKPKTTLTGKDRAIHNLRERIKEMRASARAEVLARVCATLIRAGEENSRFMADLPGKMMDAASRYELETLALLELDEDEWEEGE